MKLFGGIEAGGTKFVCLVGNGPDKLVEEKRFPTTSPDETITKVLEFFAPYANRGELVALGIASFGPVDLNRASPTFGYITTTPKPGWAQVDLCGRVKRGLNVPVAFDTDVNAAAFGEQYWTPENRALDPFLYMTVGTGIGMGAIVNGLPVHGLIHSEAGHFAIPHNWQKDPFPGVCPYHGDCLEGLRIRPVHKKTLGAKRQTLPDDHSAWDLEAEYIAFALANLIYAYSPLRIVLGGGVPQHSGLHQMVRCKVQQIINGYVHSPMVLDKMDEYIVPPTLGTRSGVMGAIALAMNAAASGLG